MKNRIKEISIDLFHKKGYFATSVSDIARAAGIRKSSIYYHYPNKEEILFDIFQTTMLDLTANLDLVLQQIDDVEKRMRAAVQSHVIFHIERQKEVFIADSELRGLTVDNYRRIIDMRNEYEQRFQTLIGDGIRERIFVPQDIKIISYAIITMCTAVSTWFNPLGRLSKEAVADHFADFVLNGLKGQAKPVAPIKLC